MVSKADMHYFTLCYLSKRALFTAMYVLHTTAHAMFVFAFLETGGVTGQWNIQFSMKFMKAGYSILYENMVRRRGLEFRSPAFKADCFMLNCIS